MAYVKGILSGFAAIIIWGGGAGSLVDVSRYQRFEGNWPWWSGSQPGSESPLASILDSFDFVVRVVCLGQPAHPEAVESHILLDSDADRLLCWRRDRGSVYLPASTFPERLIR
jgi:hypothetical protein